MKNKRPGNVLPMGGGAAFGRGLQPQQPIQINPEECIEVKCECEHNIFALGVKLLEVPVTSMSQAAGKTAQTPAYYCTKCGLERIVKQ